jgi:hypothetical protein
LWIKDPAATVSSRRLATGESADGGACAAAQRRRAAAQTPHGAVVHRLLWGWHRDDSERLANTEVTFPGGDGARRATAVAELR